jgi:4-aminobutyrate aminotransferase
MQKERALQISDVRGEGLMIAVEFGKDSHMDKSALKGVASKISKQCAEQGLLILSTSVFEVIRFIPPLNISKEELSQGIKIFEQVVRDVLKSI